MSIDQIEAFERAGYKMSGYNKRQTEARAMRAERKVRLTTRLPNRCNDFIMLLFSGLYTRRETNVGEGFARRASKSPTG